MLSSRAGRFLIDQEYLRLYSSAPAIRNPYHPSTNPDGVVNLGTAISDLMDDVWMEKFDQLKQHCDARIEYFRYYQFYGPNDFRMRIANLMNNFFRPYQPVSYENIMVLNGALVSLDILSSLLLDEGESILLPIPAYNGYFAAGVQRWKIDYCMIPMTRNGSVFELNIVQIEKTYTEGIASGKKIKAFLLNNPNNPLGKVFSKDLVIDIMKFCQRNNLHLISDEAYCMSVFDEEVKFHSVLELEGEGILDTDKCHLIWGFSKDMCLTSFRTGIIHSKNKKLIMALDSMSQFQAVPLPIMDVLGRIISDVDWIKTIFVPLNHQRMREAYNYAKSLFDELEIPTSTSTTGFFFLADLRKFLDPANEENTKRLLTKFYENKVYVVPYWEMKYWEAGWVRVVFTVSRDQMKEGVRRISNAIKEWNDAKAHGGI